MRKDTRKNIAFIRTVATSYIFLFLVHPSITNIIFQSFLCKEIHNQLWLVMDLN